MHRNHGHLLPTKLLDPLPELGSTGLAAKACL